MRLNTEGVLAYLITLGFEPVPAEDGDEIRICCSLCEDDKPRLYINGDTGTWICFHCHEQGSFHRLLLAVVGLQGPEAFDISSHLSYDRDDSDDFFDLAADRVPENPKEIPVLRLPPDFRILDRNAPVLFRRYLESRHVSLELAAARGIGYAVTGRYAYRLIVPVENDGTLYTFVARTVLTRCNSCGLLVADCACDRTMVKVLTPSAKYGARPSHSLYNLESVRAGAGSKVIVVEGVFDALRRPAEAVALLGSRASDLQLNLLAGLARGRDVVIALDGDEAGYRGALQVADGLVSWAVLPKIALLPEGEDPGHMDAEAFEACIQDAKEYVV